MRAVVLCALALAACGDDDSQPAQRPDGGAATQHLPDLAMRATSAGDAAVTTPVTDGGAPDAAVPLDMTVNNCRHCGGNQVCTNNQCMDIPPTCPCPLGSYCDLKTNTCKVGCLGNDHCPPGYLCDTTAFECAQVCDNNTPCPDHRACNHPLPAGKVCADCKEPVGDMAGNFTPTCPCEGGFDDCNHDPTDGCETPLNTLTDCHACGRAASIMWIDDKDNDQYGVAATARLACDAPLSNTIAMQSSKGEDCDDKDGNVHPGQTQWFTTPSAGTATFDYNCDGFLDVEYERDVNQCDFTCFGYWKNQAPACGQNGTAVNCFDDKMGGCGTTQPFTILQACH